MTPREAITQGVAERLFRLGNRDAATETERRFFRDMKDTSNVERLFASGLPALRDAFQKVALEGDAYYISPAYYGVTGRRGLWAYNPNEQSALLFCLHPNVQDTVLVFPPFGDEADKTLATFLDMMRPTGMNVHIGRVPQEDHDLTAIATRAFGFRCFETPEPTLDWGYPVHTIFCADLETREGPAYQPLRQAVNSIHAINGGKGVPHDARRVRVERVDFKHELDQQTLIGLAQDWAANTQAKHSHMDGYTVSSYDYFTRIFRLARNDFADMDGLVLKYDDRPIGFSVWEAPVGVNNIANLFASQIADFKGSPTHAGTYLLYKTGKAVARSGGDFLCLGGSESSTMDRFKRKFVPVQSTSLKTIVLQTAAERSDDIRPAVTPGGTDELRAIV